MRPNDVVSITITYRLLDDTGQLITVRRAVFKKEDMAQAGKDAITNITEKILKHVEIHEEL